MLGLIDWFSVVVCWWLFVGGGFVGGCFVVCVFVGLNLVGCVFVVCFVLVLCRVSFGVCVITFVWCGLRVVVCAG